MAEADTISLISGSPSISQITPRSSLLSLAQVCTEYLMKESPRGIFSGNPTVPGGWKFHDLSESDHDTPQMSFSQPVTANISDDDNEDRLSQSEITKKEMKKRNKGTFKTVEEILERKWIREQKEVEILKKDELTEQLRRMKPQIFHNGKAKTAEEILERQREQKEVEKLKKDELTEQFRRMKPPTCHNYLKTYIDNSLLANAWGRKAFTMIEETLSKNLVEIIDQDEPFTVTWRRETPKGLETEKHILYCWDYDMLISSIQSCSLNDTFKESKKKFSGYKIYLFIYGLQDYLRKLENSERVSKEKSKNTSKRKSFQMEITVEEIEMALVELQLEFQMSHQSFNNYEDLAEFICHLTKSIAELPYQLEEEKREHEKTWYTKVNSSDCVKVDDGLNGLKQLWIQQLAQVHPCSLEMAKSIAELYPTPHALFQAYKALGSESEKQNMLQDIPVIGPELSRKMYILFNERNGDVLLK